MTFTSTFMLYVSFCTILCLISILSFLSYVIKWNEKVLVREELFVNRTNTIYIRSKLRFRMFAWGLLNWPSLYVLWASARLCISLKTTSKLCPKIFFMYTTHMYVYAMCNHNHHWILFHISIFLGRTHFLYATSITWTKPLLL